MNNKKRFWSIVLMVVFTISAVNCSGQSINSPEALKEYLNKQAVNSPDKPIKVSMTINDIMFESVADVIKSSGKYVSLNITGNALTTIPKQAFRRCKTLVGITIPNSVTSIKFGAFWACTSLNSVTIGNGVTSIEDVAFAECSNLTNIIIPNSVTSIGDEAFAICTNLTSVTLGNSVNSIADGAFKECTSLTKIIIPNKVTIIEDAFRGCTKLTSVTFQGTITSANFSDDFDLGDLRTKYLAGGIGTYTTIAPVNDNSKWTKQ